MVDWPTEGKIDRRQFGVQVAVGSALLCLGNDIMAEELGAKRTDQLDRAKPESLGIDPVAVLAFIRAVEEKPGGMHSFMLLRHGKVAAEGWWTPYRPAAPHMLYSLSKSFTSTAVGLAVEAGLVHLEDTVTSYFPNALPEKVSDNLAAMRVKHLLTMSTGHDKDATGPTTAAPDGDWVRAFLALPVEHEPGSKFVYNSAATYMLSAIVQSNTGKTVLDYLTPQLFNPLGIQGQTWETCPRGINTGGWGLSVKTEDIARFGQLYLQQGEWHGKPLVPRAWVQEATTKHIANGDPAAASDWSQGYGYQFWRCRHDAFRGDGAFGQYCVVMPKLDAVLAITSGVGDMQAVLNQVWDHLLPGIQTDAKADNGGSADLSRALKRLAYASPAGSAQSPTAARVSGKVYQFAPNALKAETVSLKFDGGNCRLTLSDAKGEHTLECGAHAWKDGTASLEGVQSIKVAARGAWTADDTYTITECFYETPYVQTITFRFEGDQIAVNRKRNVAFGPTEAPPLTGKS
jgi:CubicO group peptidase (beta-lactamase class C family)